MRRVEFLRAWEGGTWDTEVLEVPEKHEDPANGVIFCQGHLEEDLVNWVTSTLLTPGNAKYNGLALFAVYNTEPEDIP